MYHSINNIDQQLHEKYFNNQLNGFYIEAGANNGLRQSNTAFFEFQRHWTGILIEAIPELAAECIVNRPGSISEHAALVAHDYNLKEIVIEYTPQTYGLMSVIKGMRHTAHHLKKAGNEEGVGKMVPAVTLDQILEKHKALIPSKIDLLSLDVEGYEPQALMGISFDKWNIEHIVIEQQYNSKETEKILVKHYKKLEQLSEHDYIWKRK